MYILQLMSYYSSYSLAIGTTLPELTIFYASSDPTALYKFFCYFLLLLVQLNTFYLAISSQSYSIKTLLQRAMNQSIVHFYNTYTVCVSLGHVREPCKNG